MVHTTSRRTWTAAAALTLALATLALTAATARAQAQDAQTTFDSLYGADLKRVAATSDNKDDLELAGRMFAAAKKTTGQADLLALLCEKAAALAGKAPAGYATAVEALELLGEKVPDKQAACRDKLILLHQGRMASATTPADRQAAGEALVDLLQDAAEDKAEASDWSGAVASLRRAQAIAESIHSPVKDEIGARLNQLSARERLETEVAALKARLKTNAADGPARERLVRILLVDLDRPEEAAQFVAGVADEALRNYVPLAAKPIDGLAEGVVQELAGWYRGLAEAAASTAQVAMYERAKKYFVVFLDKHTADDLPRKSAQLALDNIEATLARLNSATDAPGWVDVLRLVDVTEHCAGGKWERQEQKLSVAATDLARATIPVVPDGSYAVQVKFTRTDGSGPVALVLPVGSTVCALVLNADGGTAGLQAVSDKPASDNASTTRPSKIENGKEYTVDVKVITRGKQQTISAMVNGQKSVQWEGAAADLSLGPWAGLLGPRALALATKDGSVTFTSARVRILAGGVAMLDDTTKSGTGGTGGTTGGIGPGGWPGGWPGAGGPGGLGRGFGRGLGGAGGGRRGKGG